MTFSEADGELMRLALIEHLARASDPELRKEAARLANAAPRIEDGQLRIGSWLLESHEQGLALVWDQLETPAALVQKVAELDGKPGGPFRVVRVSEEVQYLEP